MPTINSPQQFRRHIRQAQSLRTKAENRALTRVARQAKKETIDEIKKETALKKSLIRRIIFIYKKSKQRVKKRILWIGDQSVNLGAYPHRVVRVRKANRPGPRTEGIKVKINKNYQHRKGVFVLPAQSTSYLKKGAVYKKENGEFKSQRGPRVSTIARELLGVLKIKYNQMLREEIDKAFQYYRDRQR